MMTVFSVFCEEAEKSFTSCETAEDSSAEAEEEEVRIPQLVNDGKSMLLNPELVNDKKDVLLKPESVKDARVGLNFLVAASTVSFWKATPGNILPFP